MPRLSRYPAARHGDAEGDGRPRCYGRLQARPRGADEHGALRARVIPSARVGGRPRACGESATATEMAFMELVSRAWLREHVLEASRYPREHATERACDRARGRC